MHVEIKQQRKNNKVQKIHLKIEKVKTIKFSKDTFKIDLYLIS